MVNPYLWLSTLIDADDIVYPSHDGNTAMQQFRAAVIILPDDSEIQIHFVRTVQISLPNRGDET